ncbi:hypothetical protein [Desulfonatronospira thiodismutans]|uniref:hypothetical protein n=1 Tax=Desulfonatronospira thiodismutans TaxID=488939 RepID=UPI0012948764|nr:hypothetical protein [Desulfonatronospira thiodismutans]
MGTIAGMFRREGDERTKSEYENRIKELKNEWFGQGHKHGNHSRYVGKERV